MDCMVGIPSRSIYGWSLNSMMKFKSVIILLHESYIYIYIHYIFTSYIYIFIDPMVTFLCRHF